MSSDSTWFADIMGDRENIGDQLLEVKAFAFGAFDKLDQNRNGYLSHDELETALKGIEISQKERSFLTFLLENHDEIAEACDENNSSSATTALGISRCDLENYFDLIASLL